MTNTKSTQTVDVRKILLGMIGERIVAAYLRSQGYCVEESLDVFDSEKDLLVDGKKVEVKTQAPIMVEDSFGISPRQKDKVMSSHKVYFVSVPLQRVADPLAGVIFEMDPQDPSLKIHKWHTIKGREVLCFPRRQAAMKQVHRITDEKILKQLTQLSTSYL